MSFKVNYLQQNDSDDELVIMEEYLSKCKEKKEEKKEITPRNPTYIKIECKHVNFDNNEEINKKIK